MGPTNMRLCKEYNIISTKYHILCHTQPIVVCISLLMLYTCLKTLFRDSFPTNLYILVTIQLQTINMPSNMILLGHLRKAFEDEKDNLLILNYKLQEYSFSPSNYKKMCVKSSTNLINYSCYTSLMIEAMSSNEPTLWSTAWFVECLTNWYSLAKSRSPIQSNKSIESEEISFLKECVDIFRGLNIGTNVHCFTSYCNKTAFKTYFIYTYEQNTANVTYVPQH